MPAGVVCTPGTELHPPVPSPSEELEEFLAQGRLVVVCWEPGCSMHHLHQWPDDQWMARPQTQGYARYSHGICPEHYRIYQREADALLRQYGRPIGVSLAAAAT